MKHETLGDETAEQPLHDAMLQMQMNNFVVQDAGIVEDDRANGRIASPFPGLLIRGRGDRSVSIVSAQVGSAPWR